MTNTERVQSFILKHIDVFTFLGLGIVFYFIFFHNIWAYALMDVDESRYVSMAKDMFNSKDYLTLYLNNEYFFEKPPLYFWGECLSFKLFGQINEFTARFPIALYGTACSYLAYFIGKKIVSRKYGIIASLILATSLEFLILAKFAILDIVVSTCIAFSLGFGLIVYFCRENHRKYYWWLFYFFSGLAVMAKGIPGFVIPFGSMFFMAVVSKKFKELFKPVYFVPGVIIFLLTTLPWHIIMIKLYPNLFWDEYIIKHHIARFVGSKVINRKEPFYFYFVTLLWGFFPWVISCVSVWIKNLVNTIKNKNYKFSFEDLTNPQKLLLYNAIIACFILLFFSSSGTKLITYILPIYMPLAFLGGFVWLNFIEKRENEKIITRTVYWLGGIFILASIAGMLTPLYLPADIHQYITTVKTFTILTSFATGLASILFAKKKLYLGVFTSYVMFMSLYSAYATEKYFEIDYKFGQDDLLKYAQLAKEKDYTLTTYGFSHKYSLIFYGGKPVVFGRHLKPSDLTRELDIENNYVIVPHKKMKDIESINFDIISSDKKYVLIDEDK